jgi:hypothetical protein
VIHTIPKPKPTGGKIFARFFGFHFGFWMAQQGSIYCFVILIFVYVYKMNKLDHKYDVDEDKDDFVPDEDYYHLDDGPDDSASEK